MSTGLVRIVRPDGPYRDGLFDRELVEQVVNIPTRYHYSKKENGAWHKRNGRGEPDPVSSASITLEFV